MPGEAKPFDRADKGAWYARIDGKRTRLNVKGNRMEAGEHGRKTLPKSTATVPNSGER